MKKRRSAASLGRAAPAKRPAHRGPPQRVVRYQSSTSSSRFRKRSASSPLGSGSFLQGTSLSHPSSTSSSSSNLSFSQRAKTAHESSHPSRKKRKRRSRRKSKSASASPKRQLSKSTKKSSHFSEAVLLREAVYDYRLHGTDDDLEFEEELQRNSLRESQDQDRDESESDSDSSDFESGRYTPVVRVTDEFFTRPDPSDEIILPPESESRPSEGVSTEAPTLTDAAPDAPAAAAATTVGPSTGVAARDAPLILNRVREIEFRTEIALLQTQMKTLQEANVNMHRKFQVLQKFLIQVLPEAEVEKLIQELGKE